ncbi:DNA-binding transcriptional MerR regulator [Bradyrhizobium sp. JR6.1]
MVTPQMAETMRNLHPLRLQYEALSSHNPWMTAVKSAADDIEESRKPVSKDNPFLVFQEQMSKQIVHMLDSWRDSQEALSEAIFLNVYGSPALQAAVGIDPKAEPSRRREMPPEHRAMLEKRIAELKSKIGDGGLREAGIRGLLYAGSVRGMVDERSLEALRNLRRQDTGARMTLSEFKMLVREQFFMLLLDQEAALAAISKLLPENANERRAAFAAIQEVLSASSEISGEVANRLNRVGELFGVDAGAASKVAPFDPKAKAS